jgi:HK97 family phage major capsid protein
VKITRTHFTWCALALLAVLAAFALTGHPVTSYIPPDILAVVGAAGAMPFAMSGEIDMKSINEALKKQGEAWEEFKKVNDERLAKVEKGQPVADLEAKLAKMNDALGEASKELKELTLKSQRPALSAEGEQKAAKELASFNAKAQAVAIETGKSFTPLSADGYAAYKSAMAGYIRKGVEKLSAEEQKAINVGTAAQGGFLVGEEMEAGIDRVVRRYSAMREIATVRTIGAATYKKLVKTSGTSGGTRGGETTAPTQGSTQQWSELEFKPGTYLSDQRITSEALEDAVQDVEADLMEEIGIEFAEMEGSDFITGDGVNGPRGIHSYSIVANASYAWGSVGYIASGGAAGFAASNPSDALIDLQHGLKRQYRGNAVWSMNDATLGTIRKFKDGQGLYLWAPSMLMQGAVGQLLGHPVVTDDFMPDLGSNTFPIAFGDFKRAYYVVDRKGVAVLRDPYTAVPYVKFVARKRVGGGIANFEALKVLKCATS